LLGSSFSKGSTTQIFSKETCIVLQLLNSEVQHYHCQGENLQLAANQEAPVPLQPEIFSFVVLGASLEG
jgi:hypothetical protein